MLTSLVCLMIVLSVLSLGFIFYVYTVFKEVYGPKGRFKRRVMDTCKSLEIDYDSTPKRLLVEYLQRFLDLKDGVYVVPKSTKNHFKILGYDKHKIHYPITLPRSFVVTKRFVKLNTGFTRPFRICIYSFQALKRLEEVDVASLDSNDVLMVKDGMRFTITTVHNYKS